MDKKTGTLFVLWVIVVGFACFPERAYAYIDLGTGSMILQMLGGLFVAGGGALAIFRKQVKEFFGRGKSKEGSSKEESELLEQEETGEESDSDNTKEAQALAGDQTEDCSTDLDIVEGEDVNKAESEEA